MRDVWERSELISSALYFILKGKSVDSVKPSCARGESAIVRIVYETLHYTTVCWIRAGPSSVRRVIFP